jgi:hypothetical protein
MKRNREAAAGSSWIPIIPLHDEETGARVYVNFFWMKRFTARGRGSVIEFVGGGSVAVEESPEQIAQTFGR